MNNQDHLFQLINSLSKSEKGYFKKYSSLHVKGVKNNYIRLFDAIDNLNEYDEEKIRKALAKEKFINHLPRTKNYLYNLILKSLREFHANSSSNATIKILIRNIELLLSKGMINQCYKLVKKAKHLSEKYESHLLLIEILILERKLYIMQSFPKNSEAILTNNFSDESDALNNILLNSSWYKANNDIHYYHKREGITREALELKGIKYELDRVKHQNKHLSGTYRSMMLEYSAYHIYNSMIGNFKESQRFAKLAVELFNKYPHQINEDLKNYITNLQNLMVASAEMEDIITLQKTSERVEQLLKDHQVKISKQYRAQILYKTILIKMSYFISKGEFEKALQGIDTQKLELEKFSQLIPHSTKLNFNYALAYSNLVCNKLDEASFWVNEILKDSSYERRNDILVYTRILNLIIQFELGNEEIMDHLIRSAQRFIDKKNRLFKLEKLILNFFVQTLHNTYSKREETELFKAFRFKLVELSESDSYWRNVERYFDFISWADSKIENKKFLTITKSKKLRYT